MVIYLLCVPNGESMPQVALPNLRMEYEVSGHGIPLLMIMGVGGQLVHYTRLYRSPDCWLYDYPSRQSRCWTVTNIYPPWNTKYATRLHKASAQTPI